MIHFKRRYAFLAWILVLIVTVPKLVVGQNSSVSMDYAVTMDQPGNHYYHVRFQYVADKPSQSMTFNMPVWTPGYYWIENFPKNLSRFKAMDEEGHSLDWKKTSKNSWKISTEGTKTITVQYDIYAHKLSVADPYLDKYYGFISPAGVFMWPKGELDQPVRVTIYPYKDWKTVSTGLPSVPNKDYTYRASDFDQLYDSPMLIGNQKEVEFDVKGIPHYLAMLHPDNFDVPGFESDLTKIIAKATDIFGEVPYKNYTFLIMGEGRGGLEHFNSAAVFSNDQVYNPNDKEEYSRWLGFLAHEYFHNFNVKRIRPVALGPFDYSRENYTRMLWVAEGFTVYYQYMLLNRTGIISFKETLKRFRDDIRSYEWIPGHKFQSATQSSFNTWIQFFNHGNNYENRTISYYDKGCILGMLMDLKIRHLTDGKKSLDDVMRALYEHYYKEKKRGYSDQEFRQTAEEIAGTSLDDIFRYASTTDNINYAKYLSYAGLTIDTTAKVQDNSFLGAMVSEQSDKLVVTGIVRDSPAWESKLSTGDTILQINGEEADMKLWDSFLDSAETGDTVELLTSLDGRKQKINLILGVKKRRSFNISKIANPTKKQRRILSGWLKQ